MGASLYFLLMCMFENFHIEMFLKREKESVWREREKEKAGTRHGN